MSPVRDAFAFQSKACAELGSPFMERLMALFATSDWPDGPVARRLRDWPDDPHPSASSLPLRVAGALHGLVLGGHPHLTPVYPPRDTTDDAVWAAVADALASDFAAILRALESPPQTNEVRRSVAILPGLHMIAARYGLPLELVELGTSAGLNLRADRFALHTATHRLGSVDAAVRLAPDWSGPAPAPAEVSVVRRTGIDLAPIDPLDPRGEHRLLSYLWPDQPDRLARTRAAIAEARAAPAEIVAGDAADFLEWVLEEPAPDRARVVVHTVAWQYFPEATARRALAALEAAGAAATEAAPLARLSMEADGGRGAALTLTLWPGGATHPLARVDFHGRWVDWTGPSALPR
ncbi:MAG: DUF2332 family protein [Paracoccaceae bacterium]|nr:DUF2332 family protein [Paracoccaceae bacterium]